MANDTTTSAAAIEQARELSQELRRFLGGDDRYDLSFTCGQGWLDCARGLGAAAGELVPLAKAPEPLARIVRMMRQIELGEVSGLQQALDDFDDAVELLNFPTSTSSPSAGKARRCEAAELADVEWGDLSPWQQRFAAAMLGFPRGDWQTRRAVWTTLRVDEPNGGHTKAANGLLDLGVLVSQGEQRRARIQLRRLPRGMPMDDAHPSWVSNPV